MGLLRLNRCPGGLLGGAERVNMLGFVFFCEKQVCDSATGLVQTDDGGADFVAELLSLFLRPKNVEDAALKMRSNSIACVIATPSERKTSVITNRPMI